MKQRITQAAHPLVSDRGILGLLLFFIVAVVVSSIFLAVTIQPSELQVVTHYSSFGTTNFYRDKWYYLLNFIGFLLVFAVVHVVLVRKLLLQIDRQLAVAYAWFGIAVVGIATLVAHQILRLAALT